MTQLYIPVTEDFGRRVKVLAASEGKSIAKYVRDALEERVSRFEISINPSDKESKNEKSNQQRPG